MKNLYKIIFIFFLMTYVQRYNIFAQVVTCGSSDKNDACANANGGIYPVFA